MAKASQSNYKLTFCIANSTNFTDFLKKFIVVDTNALLELKTDNTIGIKSFTASRTAVKMGSLRLEDIFDFDSSQSIEKNIKIGIYFVETFIKMINIVSEETNDAYLDIFYESDADGEFSARSIDVYNNSLKYNFICAQKNLFKYMSDDIVKTVFNTDNNKFEFELDTVNLKKIELITSVEKGTNIEIKLVGDQDDYELFFITKNSKWKCHSEVTVNEPDSSIVINKEHLKYIDKEKYKVFVNDSKIVLESQDSDSFVTFGANATNDDE